MSYVPWDIYRDIFLRLPWKDLLRSKAVCKRWRAAIDDPGFVIAHTNKQLSSNSNTTIIIRNSTGPPFYPFYYFDLEDLDFRISRPQTISAIPLEFTPSGLSRIPALPVAACNGLLLTAPHNPNANWEIRNPLTHERLKLPQPNITNPGYGPPTNPNPSYLPPNTTNLGYGLGYDCASDDYRAVVIDQRRQTHVYSLKSDSWKKIVNCPLDLSKEGPGVFLNGALHWVSSGEDVIVALDIGTERYRQLALPPGPVGVGPRPEYMAVSPMKLDASSGCLFITREKRFLVGLLFIAILKISFGRPSHSVFNGDRWFDAWVMNDYNEGRKESWMKLFSLDNGNIIRPVAYMKDKQQVLLQHFFGFTWFDVASKSIKSIDIHGISQNFSAQACVGSLFRLHDSCGGGRVAAAPSKTRTTNMKMGYTKLIFCLRYCASDYCVYESSVSHDDCFLSSPCEGDQLRVTSSNADIVTLPVIPLGIWRQIFLCLPANSLIRFRAVCKAWQASIDEPGFVKAHTNKQSSSTSTIVIRNASGAPFHPLYSLDLDDLDFTDGLRTISATPLDFTYSVLSLLPALPSSTYDNLSRLRAFPVTSCNGLMLITREEIFEIWNTLTHERLRLPRGEFNSYYAVMGLGYDESTDDYKVVVIPYRDPVFQVHVYSLRMDSWGIFGYALGDDWSGGPEGLGVFLCGALHWKLQSPSVRCIAILSLDLGTGIYRKLQRPPLEEGAYAIEQEIFLSVLGGCLILTDVDDYRIDVWVMKDYGDDDSWAKLFSFSVHDYPLTNSLRPVAYLKDKMQVFLQDDSWGFFMFDLERNSMKKVGFHGLSQNLCAQLVPQSIFRLHDNCGVGGKKRRKVMTRESKRKLSDTELYICVRDAKLRSLAEPEHDKCYSNWDQQVEQE